MKLRLPADDPDGAGAGCALGVTALATGALAVGAGA